MFVVSMSVGLFCFPLFVFGSVNIWFSSSCEALFVHFFLSGFSGFCVFSVDVFVVFFLVCVSTF